MRRVGGGHHDDDVTFRRTTEGGREEKIPVDLLDTLVPIEELGNNKLIGLPHRIDSVLFLLLYNFHSGFVDIFDINLLHLSNIIPSFVVL